MFDHQTQGRAHTRPERPYTRPVLRLYHRYQLGLVNWGKKQPLPAGPSARFLEKDPTGDATGERHPKSHTCQQLECVHRLPPREPALSEGTTNALACGPGIRQSNRKRRPHRHAGRPTTAPPDHRTHRQHDRHAQHTRHCIMPHVRSPHSGLHRPQRPRTDKRHRHQRQKGREMDIPTRSI